MADNYAGPGPTTGRQATGDELRDVAAELADCRARLAVSESEREYLRGKCDGLEAGAVALRDELAAAEQQVRDWADANAALRRESLALVARLDAAGKAYALGTPAGGGLYLGGDACDALDAALAPDAQTPTPANPEPNQSDADGPYAAGPVTCQACRHKWVAVRPVTAGALECPECRAMAGTPDAPAPGDLAAAARRANDAIERDDIPAFAAEWETIYEALTDAPAPEPVVVDGGACPACDGAGWLDTCPACCGTGEEYALPQTPRCIRTPVVRADPLAPVRVAWQAYCAADDGMARQLAGEAMWRAVGGRGEVPE